MTFYQSEINRIKGICYSNEGQLRTVISARNYLNDNLDREVNLDQLSNLVFTSKFHLLRLFKRYYGLTPGQYVIHRRLEESKTCLKMGMTVTQTCHSVGFESPSSFSTLFKRKIGITPSDFRKEQFSQSPFRNNS
ncbi:MAG: helix-turn-helix transcriptional regulator [Saprospiraceae bacterium]|nr:helix-turn-helix transcriptional regulator [Saprospiraceae bacterium]